MNGFRVWGLQTHTHRHTHTTKRYTYTFTHTNNTYTHTHTHRLDGVEGLDLGVHREGALHRVFVIREGVHLEG